MFFTLPALVQNSVVGMDRFKWTCGAAFVVRSLVLLDPYGTHYRWVSLSLFNLGPQMIHSATFLFLDAGAVTPVLEECCNHNSGVSGINGNNACAFLPLPDLGLEHKFCTEQCRQGEGDSEVGRGITGWGEGE